MYIFGGYKSCEPGKDRVCVNELSSIQIVNDSELEIMNKYDLSGDDVMPRFDHCSQIIGDKLYLWDGSVFLKQPENLDIINMSLY